MRGEQRKRKGEPGAKPQKGDEEKTDPTFVPITDTLWNFMSII